MAHSDVETEKLYERYQDLQRYVQWSVTDAQRIQSMAQAVEPFFTTKTKGTGVGMAIAKRIVETHGGRISVGSEIKQGAQILVTLPRQPID